jgi:hypothetical protein
VAVRNSIKTRSFVVKNKLLILLLSIGAPVIAWASDVNCPKAKVLHLQPQASSILFKQEGQDWHHLGNPESSGVQAMYSALLAAQMAGRPVIVRYPAGYDCSAYELSTPAKMVRTYNE